jgi:glycosyltransferase involved in cell wall biosynthesis
LARRVVILYRNLPAYRIAFYDALRESLALHDIVLDLVYGNSYGQDALKNDEASLDWAKFRANRFVKVGSRHAVWQPVLSDVRGADLVVVEQASRLLINYVLLAGQITRLGPKVAFWGHGGNLQRHTVSPLSEFAKARYSKIPSWWFAYTEGSRDRVTALGYPAERVTVVQNATDTVGLRQSVEQVSQRALEAFVKDHDLTQGRVALFLGSLYEDKRVDFLIEACNLIHRDLPDFRLLVGGDGPQRNIIESASVRFSWVHYLGRLDGDDRAIAVRASDVMLMPGLLGLAVLDAFAGGVPTVATAVDYHSPEIEYLNPGLNGVIVPDSTSPASYAASVVDLLESPQTLANMTQHCLETAGRITTAEMVRRFTNGVISALNGDLRGEPDLSSPRQRSQS